MDRNQNLLELLDIYMNLSDKQNETIVLLAKIIRKQSYEIQQLKGLAEEESISCERDLNLEIAADVTAEHDNLKDYR